MLAHQLKDLAPYIARYEKQIAQLFAQHPDRRLFDNLPGAGDQLAPRLLSAFGSDRDRFQSPLEAVTFFGIAPVTERSGKSSWIHFRWACANSCANPSTNVLATRCVSVISSPPFMNSNMPEVKAIMLRCAHWPINGFVVYFAAGKLVNPMIHNFTSLPWFNEPRPCPSEKLPAKKLTDHLIPSSGRTRDWIVFLGLKSQAESYCPFGTEAPLREGPL